MKTFLRLSEKTVIGLCLALLLVTFGCDSAKDDGGETTVDIMQGSTEFSGSFPSAQVSAFNQEGTSYHVECYKNQYVVYCSNLAGDLAATRIIEAAGGTILEKVPDVGYYLVETSQFQQGLGFVNILSANDTIQLLIPNIAGRPRSSTSVIDYCSHDHGTTVIQTLKDCGGSFDFCSNAMFVDPQTQELSAPMSKVIRNLLYTANANKSGATLVNLSINGGLSDCNYANLSPEYQAIARDSWFIFMQGVLMTIAALPEELRRNLVVTIAAGNENMPIRDMLDKLRLRDRIPEVLRDNVLIVSTSRMIDPPANYAPDDEDVVIMNNQMSEDGTSFAAPCALGMLQKVMEEKKIGAHEALAVLKQASRMNPKGEILWSDVLPMVEYSMQPTTVAFGPYVQHVGPYDCESMLYFNINPSLFWNSDKGTLIIPTHYYRTVTGGAGCIMTGVIEDDKTYQIMLLGSNNAISGSGLENIRSGGVNPENGFCGFYNAMVFHGAANSNNTITGVLDLIMQYPMGGDTMQVLDSRSINVTFNKK